MWVWHLVIHSKKIRQSVDVSEQVARKISAPRNSRLTGQKKLYGWKNLNKRGQVRKNVTLRHTCVTTAAVEERYVLHILSVSVPSDIQHVQHMRYIAICGQSGSTIFFHIISHTAQFSTKSYCTYKNVFLLPLQLLSETFLFLRITEQDTIINFVFSFFHNDHKSLLAFM